MNSLELSYGSPLVRCGFGETYTTFIMRCGVIPMTALVAPLGALDRKEEPRGEEKGERRDLISEKGGMKKG